MAACRTTNRGQRRLAMFAVVGLGVAASSVGLAGSASADPDICQQVGSTVTCNYAAFGAEQTFVVPAGVTQLSVEATGGEGGGAGFDEGGAGAIVTGNVTVTPGQTLYVEVGSSGDSSTPGWNGGGTASQFGWAGGGASDIRTIMQELAGSTTSRLIVAGGGGGGANGAGGGDCMGVGGKGGFASSTGVGGSGCLGTGGTGGGGGVAGTDGDGGAGGDDSITIDDGTGGFNSTEGGFGGATNGGSGGGGYGGGGGGGGGSGASGGGGGGGGGNLIPSGGTSSLNDAGGDGKILISYQAPASSNHPTITGTPTTANIGEAYSYTFHTTGSSPRMVTKSAGSLPPGLTLSSNGNLHGKPTKAGTYHFTVRVTNNDGSGTHAVTLTVRPPASIKITGGNVTEGNSGTKSLPFKVTLSRASSLNISVHYATSNGSATAPKDYTSKSGTLTFSPGQTSKTVSIPIVGDKTREPKEVFYVGLNQPYHSTIATAKATGGIFNDD